MTSTRYAPGRLGVLLVCAALAAAAIVSLTHPIRQAQAAKKKSPSIKAEAEGKFQRAQFKLITHQVYESYYQAAQTLQEKDYETTDAFLTVLNYYIDKLDDYFPGVDYKGEPIDKKEFMRVVVKLKKEMSALQADVRAKKKSNMEDPEKALASTCLMCHDSVVFSSKVRPTP